MLVRVPQITKARYAAGIYKKIRIFLRVNVSWRHNKRQTNG